MKKILYKQTITVLFVFIFSLLLQQHNIGYLYAQGDDGLGQGLPVQEDDDPGFAEPQPLIETQGPASAEENTMHFEQPPVISRTLEDALYEESLRGKGVSEADIGKFIVDGKVPTGYDPGALGAAADNSPGGIEVPDAQIQPPQQVEPPVLDQAAIDDYTSQMIDAIKANSLQLGETQGKEIDWREEVLRLFSDEEAAKRKADNLSYQGTLAPLNYDDVRQAVFERALDELTTQARVAIEDFAEKTGRDPKELIREKLSDAAVEKTGTYNYGLFNYRPIRERLLAEAGQPALPEETSILPWEGFGAESGKPGTTLPAAPSIAESVPDNIKAWRAYLKKERGINLDSDLPIREQLDARYRAIATGEPIQVAPDAPQSASAPIAPKVYLHDDVRLQYRQDVQAGVPDLQARLNALRAEKLKYYPDLYKRELQEEQERSEETLLKSGSGQGSDSVAVY